MSKQISLVIPILLGVLLLSYLIYSAMSLSPIICEVTMEFNGRTDTRQASGVTEQEATTTAINNACTLITNGRDESMACGADQPVSVECAES
jgi:ABC-type microcin C transport system permease subunit YejB